MPVFYVNGVFVDADHAALPVSDLSILRGYGAFDYLRTYNGKPFRLSLNLERLRRSCDLIGLEYAWSDDELHALIMETLARNGAGEFNIRIVITGGSSPDNITPQNTPSLIIMVTPIKPNPAEWYTHGVKVATVQMERFLPGAKTINYIPAILAQREARAQGGIEALYVDNQGHVREGTTTNIFIFQDGTLITPEEDLLPGITRRVVLEVAQGVYPVVIRPIALEELYQADEAFITASNKLIVPIVQVNETTIGSGKVGEKTQHIMALFRDLAEKETQAETISVQ